MKVTDILGNMPDPTQFGIHGDVLEAEKTESSELVVPADMVQMTGAGAEKLEPDMIMDLLNTGGKKEGKHGAEPGLGDVCEVLTEVSAPAEKKTQVCILYAGFTDKASAWSPTKMTEMKMRLWRDTCSL